MVPLLVGAALADKGELMPADRAAKVASCSAFLLVDNPGGADGNPAWPSPMGLTTSSICIPVQDSADS